MVDVAFSAWGGINMSFDRDNDENTADLVIQRGRQGISSRHPGGVNVCRADGSVSLLTDGVDGLYATVNFNFPGDSRNGQVIDGSNTFVVQPIQYGAYEKACAVADGQPSEEF